MGSPVVTFDTAHGGALHDAQLDYYAKRLATASSDHSIRVWDVSVSRPQYLAELVGHSAAVWRVSWSHPKYGNLLASCSYDKKVIVWKEVGTNDWQIAFIGEEHSASVNSLAWSSWEVGLHLASASSDGGVCVWSYREDDVWSKRKFVAHSNGVNAVSWAPSSLGGSLDAGLQLVTGGCDNQVRVWAFNESLQSWSEKYQMNDSPHTDWVRDVAWRPNVGLPYDIIASASEDRSVILWAFDKSNKSWKNSQTIKFDGPAWTVAWSITGSILAVASGDGQISLFKETTDGFWDKITNLNEQSNNNDHKLHPNAFNSQPHSIPEQNFATQQHHTPIEPQYNPTNFNSTNVNSTNFNSTNFNSTNFNPTNFNSTNFNPTNFNTQNTNQVTRNEPNIHLTREQLQFNKPPNDRTTPPSNYNPNTFPKSNLQPTNFNQNNNDPTNFNQNSSNSLLPPPPRNIPPPPTTHIPTEPPPTYPQNSNLPFTYNQNSPYSNIRNLHPRH